MICFLDLDGPILDVSEKYYRAYADSLMELGADVLEKSDYWESKRRRIPDEQILAKTGSAELLNDFKKRRLELIEDADLMKLDYVWPEVKEAYQILCSRVPAVLVTLRTHPDRVQRQLANLGISPWFDKVLAHSAITNGERWQVKVNLINRLDILKTARLEDCVFIGDTETDILAGQHLGMKTIAVSFGIRTRDILTGLKPDVIMDTPKALSTYLRREYL